MKGGASRAGRQPALTRLLAKPKPKPVMVPRAHAKEAVALAKQVVADPHATREQKRDAVKAAYHAARHNPKVLEANVVPAKGVERVVGQTLLDLSDAAIHAPGGAYAAGKAVGQDVNAAAHGQHGFKHTRAIASAMAKGTLEDVQHPLRHPGFTLLDALAAASAGAGAVSRAGEAGRALRAGEVGRAAKAVVKGPLPGTRTYTHNGLEVATPNSKNALLRAGQKTHARIVNQSENVGRQAKVAGKHLHQKERAITAVERAPADALAARGKRLSTPQETALRAVHEQTPLEATIKMHEGELAKAKRGSQRFTNLQRQIALHHAAKRYVTNINGVPELKAEYKHFRRSRSPQRLAEVSGRIEDVSAKRTQSLVQAGKLTEEGAASRHSAPGRVARGAKYEKPTPAKMGVPSKGLVRQRAVVAELEKRHEKGLERAAKNGKPYPDVTIKVAGRDTTVKRDVSLPEAEARLATLDKNYEAAIKHATPMVDPYQGNSGVMDINGKMRTVKQEDQRFRNMKSGKGGSGARYHEKQKSVSEEVRQLAADKLDRMAAKRPESELAKMIAERDRLRAAINEHKLGGLGSAEKSLYHIAPKSQRENIQREGLQDKLTGKGTFLWDNPEDARAYLKLVGGGDVWEVKGQAGLKFETDPWWTPERRAAWPGPGSSVVTHQGIEPGRLVRHEGVPAGGTPPLGKVTQTVKGKPSTKHIPSDLPARNVLSNPINTRVGGALSVARDRLARMEAAAAKREKPVGIVGAEDFTGGRSRIPYTMDQGRPMSSAQSSYRGGEPRKPGSLTHSYTGALQRSGGYRTKSSRLVAEASLEAQKYTDTLRLRDQVLQGSVEHLPAQDSEHYIAVRTGSAPMPPELRNLEHKVEEGVTLSGAEKQLLADSFDNWKQQIFAEPTTLRSYKGFRFVRREVLAKANQPRPLANVAHYKALRGAGHVVSETNNAVRTALLYLAPKYAIPNIGGNIVLNISQQGLRAVPNFYRTLKVVDRNPDLAAKFRSAMGEGFVKQLEPTSGITRRVSEPLAQGWSKIVDEKFRESALLDELRTLGFKTRDELHAAFDDPHNQPKMVEAIQRAQEAIGDYDRLGPVEKDVLRHAIFFYTWLKVSARLSKMYVTERPIQSAAIANLGQLGEQKQRQELGPQPSFAEPVFKVAGSKAHPVTSNASALNVFTAADMTKSLINFVKGDHAQSGYQIADNLSPFFSLAVTAITGRDPFTQAPTHGNLGNVALDQLTAGLPQVALKQRLDRAHSDQSGKFYTYTPKQALGQFALGPLGPRGLNPGAAEELAAKEHLAGLPPAQRSRVTVFARRQKFYDAAKTQQELVGGRLPKPLRDAFNLEAARQGAYTDATHRANAKPGTPEYHHARLKADVQILLSHGEIDRAHAQPILVWADQHAHDVDQLKAYRRYLSDTFYQSDNGFLTVISQWRKWLTDHGAKGLD